MAKLPGANPTIAKFYKEHLFTVSYWKKENEEKEAGNGPFLSLWLVACNGPKLFYIIDPISLSFFLSFYLSQAHVINIQRCCTRPKHTTCRETVNSLPIICEKNESRIKEKKEVNVLLNMNERDRMSLWWGDAIFNVCRASESGNRRGMMFTPTENFSSLIFFLSPRTDQNGSP